MMWWLLEIVIYDKKTGLFMHVDQDNDQHHNYMS